jgi:hypothetical protein
MSGSFGNNENNNIYDGNGGWTRWSQYVKLSIQELKRKQEKIQDEIGEIDKELQIMKTRVAIWGVFGAAIFTAIVQLIPFLAKGLVK